MSIRNPQPIVAMATLGQAVDADAAAIIGATDGASRQLVRESTGADFLPYNVPFDIEVELIEVKAEKSFTAQGIRVKFRVVASNTEAVVVNREYNLNFYDRNAALADKPWVLAEMAEQRIRFAAALDEYQGDPLALNADGSPQYRAAPVLLDLHRRVEPIGIRMRFSNVYRYTTKNGARLHKLHFALV